ncbi:MAG: DinB family protein [Bryobacteraceae bacterium]|nr:DinB family protein [Bryobacteraceae bacterium]
MTPELLERFRRGADLVAEALAGVSKPELDREPEPGKWTIRQIACHLADSEAVGAMRLRQVIAEDDPNIIWYDEKGWANYLDYDRRDLALALEQFLILRRSNFELIRELPDETFQRFGTHSKLGRVSLEGLVRIYAEHAEGHAGQIRRLRDALA